MVHTQTRLCIVAPAVGTNSYRPHHFVRLLLFRILLPVLIPPKDISLLYQVHAPAFHLRQDDLIHRLHELLEIHLAAELALILDRLEEHLDLVDVMHEAGLDCLVVLVLAPETADLLRWGAAVVRAQQLAADVPLDRVGLAPGLLGLGDAVDGGDVADERLGQVVDERELGAPVQVEPVGEAAGREHGDDGHAVHVVGDGLAGGDAEAAPSLALGGLEPVEQVEEGDWAWLGWCWWVGERGEGFFLKKEQSPMR